METTIRTTGDRVIIEHGRDFAREVIILDRRKITSLTHRGDFVMVVCDGQSFGLDSVTEKDFDQLSYLLVY